MSVDRKQFEDILALLLERSQKNEVNWRDGHYSEYFVEFPNNSRIAIAYISPDSEPDRVVATLIVNNEEIATIRAEDGQNSNTFTLLRMLWLEAYRTLTGWDRALAEIEAALTSEDPVGLRPAETRPTPYSDDVPPADNIPF
jgi:hypothetical protein